MIFSVIVHVAKRKSCICLINHGLFKGRNFPIDLETQVFYFSIYVAKLLRTVVFYLFLIFTKNAEK